MVDTMFVEMQKKSIETWKKSIEGSIAQVETFYSRLAELEKQRQSDASALFEEWTRLIRETTKYQAEVTATFRDQTLAVAQRITTTLMPKTVEKTAEQKTEN